MKKTALFNKLNTSVVQQSAQAKDKFENADLVVALAQVKGGMLAPAPAVVPAPTAAALVPAAPASASVEQEYTVLILPIDKVKDHPRNARHIYDPARIDEMATSIARDGQKMPAVVMPDPSEPGTYLLIEGRYRKRALVSLGRDTIIASVIEPLSELEAYRLSLMLNEERNEQTALDNALAWRALLDDQVFKSQEHIADFLNIKQGTVAKTLSLLDLPANVLAIVKASPGNFGVRIGYELRQLAKVFPAAKMEAIAEQIRAGELTVKDLERLRARGEKDPVTRERSRAYVLQWGERDLGSVREFDDGRLKLDLSNTTAELRTKIIDAVKQILADTPQG